MTTIEWTVHYSRSIGSALASLTQLQLSSLVIATLEAAVHREIDGFLTRAHLNGALSCVRPLPLILSALTLNFFSLLTPLECCDIESALQLRLSRSILSSKECPQRKNVLTNRGLLACK
jgi:hypothetical protein